MIVRDEQRAFVCFGGPGVGKTVLMSLIIDYLCDTLKGQLVGVAWCYCDYRERLSLTPVTFAVSLLRQLSVQTRLFLNLCLTSTNFSKVSLHRNSRDIL